MNYKDQIAYIFAFLKTADAAFARFNQRLDNIEKQLGHVKQLIDPSLTAGVIEFFVTINGVKRRVESMFLALDQKLPMSLEIKDKAGNPAKVDGAPAWAVTDETLGKVEAGSDGMTAMFVPAGLPGILKVQVKCDADLGSGIQEIVGELDIEVLSGQAVFVGIVAGTPEPV